MSVIQEAYIHRVSTRKVDELIQAMGLDNAVSRSEVSRVCQALIDDVNDFRQRPLGGDYLYLWFDATYLKVREGSRVVSRAMLITPAINSCGECEVVGFQMGSAVSYESWLEFFRCLVVRGLGIPLLVIRDAH